MKEPTMADRKKILIIDDDPDYRAFCSAVLKAEGHEVITSATAEKWNCHRRIRKARPHYPGSYD